MTMTPEIKRRIEQIRRGEVPEGYKRIGHRIMPQSWKRVSFEKIATIRSGLVSPQKEPFSSMLYIGPENIEKDTGRIQGIKSASELGLISGKFYFDSSSIVYSKIRPNLNKVCAPDFEGICSADCYSISVKDGIHKAYLLNFMLSREFYRRAVASSMRTGMPKINQDDLNLIALAIPPGFNEQQKIAAILTTQDRVIELKEKLLAEKQRQKKYLMQQLLTGKKRLPGFNGEWKCPRAKEIFLSVSNKNHNGNLEVLSATQDKGIVQRDQIDIDIKYDKSSLSNYKKVEAGNFVISLRSFQGGIEYSAFTGLVSPAYTVLQAKTVISAEFYKQFFKSENYINRLNGAVYGIRDGKQISYEDFGRLQIPSPAYEEQTAIAEVLSTADREIDLLRQDIEQERQKKKALMQLLLTGIVRVTA